MFELSLLDICMYLSSPTKGEVILGQNTVDQVYVYVLLVNTCVSIECVLNKNSLSGLWNYFIELCKNITLQKSTFMVPPGTCITD